MIRRFIVILCIAVSAVVASAGLGPTVFAQPSATQPMAPAPAPAAKPVSAWVKLCEKTRGGDTCLTTHERLDGDSGTIQLKVAVREVDRQPRRRLLVSAPPGVNQATGLQLTVYTAGQWYMVSQRLRIAREGLATHQIPITACDAKGCTAEADLDEDTVVQMLKGGGLTIEGSARVGKLSFEVSLAGFGDAFSGPAIDGAAYARQRQDVVDAIKRRLPAAAGNPTGKP